MRSLAVITALLLASIAFPAGAQEPTYGGRTAVEWQAIAELVATTNVVSTPAPISSTDMPSYNWAPEVEAAIVHAAHRFEVDLVVLAEIVRCESGGNPGAKNPRSSASGLGQHIMRYWSFRAEMSGHPGASPFDPIANADATAWLLSVDGTAPWAPYSGHCSRAY